MTSSPSSSPSESTPMSPISEPRPRLWRFALPLTLQVLLVLLIPAQAAYTYFMGQSVVLQTAPVDPYSLLQGYYVILGYEISRPEALSEVPGWAAIESSNSGSGSFRPAQEFYVVMAPPEPSEDGEPSAMPRPWMPVRVTGDRPTDLTSGQVAIRGRYQQGRIVYGLEQYFIPEEQRDEINERIRQAQGSGDPESYVVEVRVSGSGNAVPVQLWVDGITYRF